MFSESQLSTWAALGPTAQFTDTYNRIRTNLLDASAPYSVSDVSVFLQGSYCNDTNVYGDSDVDIVLCHTGAFFRDVTRLSNADRQAYEATLGAGVAYGYPEFKRDATAYITRLYNNVRAGGKALHIPGGSSGRRNADVLISSDYRRYYEFKTVLNQRFDPGIGFTNSGGLLIDNYPKLHSANCTKKHQNTNSYFKPTVRIFKNMRNKMTERGLLANGVAPSYFIEGMIYNVPNPQFGQSYQQTWINCFNYLAQCDHSKLTTASNMHWLVRDGSHTSWPVLNFNLFLGALKSFWEA